MSNNNKLRSNIIKIVKDILHNNHTDYEKRQLVDEKEDQLEMACPVCGDSTKDSNKKRGILYLDTFKYYCWNGECTAKYWSIFKFFRLFGQRLTDLSEIQQITKIIESAKRLRKPTKLIESSEHFEFMYKNALQKEKIMNFYGLFTSDECKWGKEEIDRRLLNKFKDNILFRTNKYNNREMWVLNKIDENDKIVGLQIKNLDFNSGSKYTTKSFIKLFEDMKIDLEYPDIEQFKEKITNFSTIFNLFNVDLEEIVTVFEGPIDSFFLPNSIATGGASKLKNFFDDLDTFRYFYDNDSTGKNTTIDKIKSRNSCFLWKKFFTINKFDNKKIKDLNELIMYVYKNREFAKSVKSIKDCYSKNKFDIYHV